MYKILGTGFLLIAFTAFVSAQAQTETKKQEIPSSLFDKGNSQLVKSSLKLTGERKEEVIHFGFSDPVNKESNKATETWEEALRSDPQNSNYNYKAGLAYFFSFDQQHKALPYFQKAIKKMTPSYEFGNKNESAAPFTALYFLAESWLLNNKPDSALKYFAKYYDKGSSANIECSRSILMALNAKSGANNLRNVTVKKLASEINTSYPEANPVAAIDNTTLFFSSRRPAQPGSNTKDLMSSDIYYTKRSQGGGWEKPVLFPHSSKDDETPLYLSLDGKTLYFSVFRGGNSDIFYSKLTGEQWSSPASFSALNSSSNETGLSFTADGKTLYFCSDRDEQGKSDIYQCRLDSKGTWSTPKKVPGVNSSFDEYSPFITPDGRTLFFSSNGFAGKGNGGLDIYYSEQDSKGRWTSPLNIGYPINKTRDDIHYYIASGNKRYYTTINEAGSYDIYEVEGGGFDFESIAATTDVLTVTNEMSVTELLETQKEVEKEVEVTQTIETEVEKEMEVEIVKEVEVEKEKEVEVNSGAGLGDINVDDLNVENLDSVARAALVKKVKEFLLDEIKEKESVRFKTIFFDFNKSNLSLLSINELKLFVEFLNEHPETKVELAGHADNLGSWETNLQLSTKRAKQVYDFLVQNKVSPDRMFFYGKGSAVPTAPNDTEENRSRNRRVDVFILK